MKKPSMSPSKWSKLLLICVTTFVCVTVTTNLVVDPYGIFGTGYLRSTSMDNDRHQKIMHLIKNPKKYDSFILGSSTAGMYSIYIPNALRSNTSWYNLAFLSGMPSESLIALKTFKKNGGHIKQVMLSVDMFQLRDYRELSDSPTRILPPAATNQSNYSYYASYLFQGSAWHTLLKLMEQKDPIQAFSFDINTGTYSLPQKELDMHRNPEKLLNKARKKASSPIDFQFNSALKKDYIDLIDWLKSEGIKTTVVMSPINPLVREKLSSDILSEFKSIVKSQNVDPIDLTGYSNTPNDFYDLMHFRPIIGTELEAKIFDQ